MLLSDEHECHIQHDMKGKNARLLELYINKDKTKVTYEIIIQWNWPGVLLSLVIYTFKFGGEKSVCI